MLLGLALAIYTLRAAYTGRVHAKAGIGGRAVSRAEDPEYFWVVILIYLGLSIALITAL
jgi:hypothetical protein